MARGRTPQPVAGNAATAAGDWSDSECSDRHRCVSKLDKKTQRLEDAVFGPNRNNGLVGANKDLDMRMRRLEIGQAKIGVLAGLVTGAIMAGASHLFGG